jgi:transcription antitermination factor NusG
VHWLGKPAIVRSEEIDTIKMFLQEFENVSIADHEIVEKDHVIIKQGILMNYKGMVLEVLGNNAKVLINSMGISLYAIFDKKNLLSIK